MKDTEIEVKVKVKRSKPLVKLLKNKAKFIKKSHQTDHYFTPAHRNFLDAKPTNEWLRLRNSDGKFSINYKNWHIKPDGTADYCDEFETGIEEIKQLRKIFSALNFRHLVTVDKIRQLWMYKHYEISLDLVKNLGDFVEIELKRRVSNKKPDQIIEEMIEFLKEVGCKKIERDNYGYPANLIAKKSKRKP